jgi:hypothetical protein
MKELNYTKLFNYIKDNRLDLAESYSDWLKLCAALVPDYEDLFIAISSYADSYNEAASRKLFVNMRKQGTHSSIATLLYMVKQSGVSEDVIRSFYEEPERDESGSTIKQELPKLTPAPIQQPKKEEPTDFIPAEYADRNHSYDSAFVDFLCTIFTEDEIRRLAHDYIFSAAKDDRSMIFWKINEKGQVTEGKIMRYLPSGARWGGHSDPDESHKNDKARIRSVTYILKEKGLIKNPPKACLFGLHLLNLKGNEEKTIIIVESEKSALVGAACLPQYIWMATGGCSGFNAEMLRPLKGRVIVAIPDLSEDSKMFQQWKDKARQIDFATVVVSDILERNATEGDKARALDVADYLIRERKAGRLGETKHELTACERALLRFEQRNPAMKHLVEVFNLKPISYEQTIG